MVLWKGFSNFVQSLRTKVVLQPIVGVSSEADVENERTLGILASKNKPTILMSEDSVSIYDCILLQKLWQSSKPKERLRVAMANPQKGDPACHRGLQRWRLETPFAMSVLGNRMVSTKPKVPHNQAHSKRKDILISRYPKQFVVINIQHRPTYS